MICMSTSLPISIKLPNRIVGVDVPVGTWNVPCAAAHDATASTTTTPRSAICARRFMIAPFSALLLHVQAVHQRQMRADMQSRGPPETGADAPVYILRCACTSFLG